MATPSSREPIRRVWHASLVTLLIKRNSSLNFTWISTRVHTPRSTHEVQIKVFDWETFPASPSWPTAASRHSRLTPLLGLFSRCCRWWKVESLTEQSTASNSSQGLSVPVCWLVFIRVIRSGIIREREGRKAWGLLLKDIREPCLLVTRPQHRFLFPTKWVHLW